jgi:hypothetical protein
MLEDLGQVKNVISLYRIEPSTVSQPTTLSGVPYQMGIFEYKPFYVLLILKEPGVAMSCYRHAKKRNKYRISVVKPEGKRPLRIPRQGNKTILRMDIREIGWGDMDSVLVSQDSDQWRPLVCTAVNARS